MINKLKTYNFLIILIFICIITACFLLNFRLYYPLAICLFLTLTIYFLEERDSFDKFLQNKIFIVILGALLSVVYFVAVLGTKILDFQYMEWLMTRFDPAQHFLGWNFFRNESWNLPLGKIENFGYPQGTSILYTDSIPILAFVFKIFAVLLPQNFQYFGLWILLCYILQGIFGFILVRSITQIVSIQILSVMFFIISPIMLWRAYGHEALMAHWILLVGIILFLKRDRFPIYKWLLLVTISLLVHPYIFFMVTGLFLVQLFDMSIMKKIVAFKFLVMYFLILAVDIVFILWLEGYFVLGQTGTTGGFGHYNYNLTSFFNPQGWSNGLIQDRPTSTTGQYEGFSYFGAGIIIVLSWAFFQILQKPFLLKVPRKYLLGLSIIFASYLALAISNIVTFDNHTILTIPINDILASLLGIFRASGRLIWPLYYMIIFFALYVLIKGSSKKTIIILLSTSLFIQYYDLSKKMEEFHGIYNKSYVVNNPIKSDFWSFVSSHFEHIVYIPLKDDEYLPFAYFASNHTMTLNIGYFARQNYEKRSTANEQQRKELLNGSYNDKTLYIIDKSVINQYLLKGLEIYNIDGYFVFIPQMDSFKNELSKYNLVKLELPKYNLDQEVLFGKNGNYVNFGISGWEQTSGEDGTWTEGNNSELLLVANENLNEFKNLFLSFNTFPLINENLNSQHLIVKINDIIIWDGSISKEEKIKIPIPNTVLSKPNTLNIKFLVPTATSPKSIGINQDVRILGLHFKSLQITSEK
jgi:hypothetical protein